MTNKKVVNLVLMPSKQIHLYITRISKSNTILALVNNPECSKFNDHKLLASLPLFSFLQKPEFVNETCRL